MGFAWRKKIALDAAARLPHGELLSGELGNKQALQYRRIELSLWLYSGFRGSFWLCCHSPGGPQQIFSFIT
jgi:hypothetical protein